MANNKVQLANGTVLIDITDTTAVASDVAAGKYFYDAAGVKTLGTNSGGGGSGGEPSSIQVYIEQDEDGYLLLTDTTLIPTAKGVSF